MRMALLVLCPVARPPKFRQFPFAWSILLAEIYPWTTPPWPAFLPKPPI